jgi:hypothetical protein
VVAVVGSGSAPPSGNPYERGPMTALSAATVATEAQLEFDRQVDALALTGLPEHLDLAESCFTAWLEPLRDQLPQIRPGDGIPFVVVVPELPVAAALEAVHMVGGTGFTTMDADDVARFRPLPELDLPEGPYLLLDVDTGAGTLGQPPVRALETVAGAGRSPLTVAEGLCLLVSEPGALQTRNSFAMAGSRAGDERVPGLWVSERRPRLGWVDQGGPHAWLGTASCAGRLGEQPVGR